MSAPQVFRIFVSSPGDTQFERQRVDRVVARLNGVLLGTARLVTVRWETDFYKAHDTFQAQIPASTECSVVLAIFKARLGTELPPDFDRMADGEAYPSGTAYEVLTAIAERSRGADLPDVFVFRSSQPPVVRLDDPAGEAETRTQWERLSAFFRRWFLTEEGHFKAAFQTFESTDDFEEQVERLLRDWLRQRLSQQGIVAWPISTKGSPFPGLQSFGPRHAPVFFGRGHDIARGTDAWRESGIAPRLPFLLVVGASGTGKSSLAAAGLVPRLTTPGVVAAVDVWRLAAMRPGGSTLGPVAALAHALLEATDPEAAGEEGRLAALPEIASGAYRTPADLAALLAHADETSVRPIVAALDAVGEAERKAHGFERTARCDLVIQVDQLDELFASAVPADERTRFVALLGALLASGRVWIVTTLRADLYELFLKEPGLLALKEAGATLDLAPPGLADMAEAVRGPAEAAGLVWEVHPETREPLDARLIREIDRPDLLPIVQFTLDRLFERRVVRDGETVLTHADYDALGTIDGAIDKVAEAVIAELGPPAIEALPRLLRTLVSFTSASTSALRAVPTLRQALRSEAVHDPASERLVAALTDARVLTSGQDGTGKPVVALAHQRVIEVWARAREVIRENAALLRIRGQVEAAWRTWSEAGQRRDLLIPRGLPLSEAESAVKALPGELPGDLVAYVERSGRAARLTQRLVAAAALVFLALALGAGALGVMARHEQQKAEQAALEAEEQTRRAEAQRREAEDARRQAELERQQAEAARRQAEAARQAAETSRREAELRQRDSQVRLAAADELLNNTGGAETLRRCLDLTDAANAGPLPKPSRAFFVGRWHVAHGDVSTDWDWAPDGTCRIVSEFQGSKPSPIQVSACSWRYVPVSETEFAIDIEARTSIGPIQDRLPFRLVTPTRIHNTKRDYDAFRIVCTAVPADKAGNEAKR